ncbi:MAG TPA: hypothetical protein VHW09_10780 [Bryobacteraceae bacterium]|jgi:xylulokinase|nr:hypothetical protein [Bryobacteraceae bacterium]
MVTLATQERSAYGTELLALAGTGEYGSMPEVCRNTVRETESVSPRPAESTFYTQRHAVYKSLYPALKPVFGKIGEL